MKVASLEDSEIIEIAISVLSSITEDLKNGFYLKQGGTLELRWSVEKRASAKALSNNQPNSIPIHQVVICDELVCRLYRDVENYHLFMESDLLVDPFKTFFKDSKFLPVLPIDLKKEDSIRNMFIGALTWVFFHEIGHLVQEHGYIRAKFGGSEQEAYIEDCELNGVYELGKRESLISHITEFAADVEAVQFCVQELVRHFLPEEENTDESSLNEFNCNLFLISIRHFMRALFI